jgi:hypothetical protein
MEIYTLPHGNRKCFFSEQDYFTVSLYVADEGCVWYCGCCCGCGLKKVVLKKVLLVEVGLKK